MANQQEHDQQVADDAQVRARQRVRETQGEVVGVEAESEIAGGVEVEQDIGVVGAGGSAIGVRLGGGVRQSGDDSGTPPAKPLTDAERRTALQARLVQYERNLADLNLREAQYGLDTPTALRNEIRATQKAIADLQSQLDELAETVEEARFCPNCGAAAAPAARFCANCGKPL